MELSNGSGEISEAELIQAHSHAWNHSMHYIHSMSLRCAIQLGILDLIHAHRRPMTLPELVSALSIHPSKSSFVHRLMRILIHSGFIAWNKINGVGEGEDEGYVLTLPSKILLKENPSNISPMMLLLGDPILVNPFYCLSKWFYSNDAPTAFVKNHGQGFWDCAGHDPETNQVINQAMESDTPLVAGALINKCRGTFEQAGSVVDVGGGTGGLARAIAGEFPNVECTVLDLPHVVCGLKEDRNLRFMGGDMFMAVPHADVVLLKWVLHDWSDDRGLEILKRCKEAITSNVKMGKLIVIEMVTENHEKKDENFTETELLLDLLMMVTLTGKERSEKEWARLFSDAGFTDYKITPLVGSRSIIEVYP